MMSETGTRAWTPFDKAEMDGIVALMRTSPFFSGWTLESLADLASKADDRILGPGQILWNKGSKQHFALIVSGEVEVVVTAGTTDAVLGRGAVLGLSTLARGAHTADVAARDGARCAVWRAQDMRTALLADPERTLGGLLEATRIVVRQSEELRLWKGRASRRAILLWHLAQFSSDTEPVFLSVDELAARVGLRKWTVSRTLAEFAREGAIRRDRSQPGQFWIVDLGKARRPT